MSRWKEGIRNFAGGIQARVPKINGDYYIQHFKFMNHGGVETTVKAAKKWQEKRAKETWGKEWEIVLLQGRHKSKLKPTVTEPSELPPNIRRRTITTTNVKGVEISRTHILLSYKQIVDGEIRPRYKRFPYTDEESEKEAIKLAIKHKKMVDRRYVNDKTKLLKRA